VKCRKHGNKKNGKIMKTLILTLAFIPGTALAQFDEYIDLYYDKPVIEAQQPVYGIPVQPILPVPRGNGPWGTGYSVVTTTRTKRPSILGSDYDRDLTGEETVTRIVPNDALGNPIRGVDLW